MGGAILGGGRAAEASPVLASQPIQSRPLRIPDASLDGTDLASMQLGRAIS
jgi:hypothetical protein